MKEETLLGPALKDGGVGQHVDTYGSGRKSPQLWLDVEVSSNKMVFAWQFIKQSVYCSGKPLRALCLGAYDFVHVRFPWWPWI
jgi:hypothetical protein